ncbi:hypothetical protein ACIPIN_06335 [Pseudomonas sp. NPDC087697]|uniref:hypothetical protein n=1 Tax=Pseudomonas sp. NPDC087697 TaxID=3364447 RepID=UPI0037F1E3FD
MNTSYLDPLRQTIAQLPISPPPSPWEIAAQFAVGSLLEVGFDRDSELLLVTSSAGRSVIDCLTGQKIATDYTGDVESNQYLEAEGIGPLAGRAIPMAGINGGSLPVGAFDGWVVENVPLNWPCHHLLLIEPGSWLHGARYKQASTFHKLAIEIELRAFGFSYTGRTLVIATSSSLIVYRRRTALKATL